MVGILNQSNYFQGMKWESIFLAALSVGLFSLSKSEQEPIPYELQKPSGITELPPILHEVSGLTVIDEHTLACVQDEDGMLFLLDAKTKTIQQQIHFYVPGDYEGLAPVGKNMYVLRSDGMLFELKNYRNPKKMLVDSIQTGIPAADNEGFCYDIQHKQLLIGCKSKASSGPEGKFLREIYAFDLRKKQLKEIPAFTLDTRKLVAFAEENKLTLHQKDGKTGKEPLLKVRISALYLHPQTKQLYVLSAADHYLFVLNPDGKIHHIEALDKDLFNKSEGIAIQKNGTLFVSNEGQDKKPTILEFIAHE